ncbi:hypothetical protein ID866_9189 [Astraeus odoratus]|nr:hypothetical protein ID866_9189 [Astraeus odoratus]
METILSVSSNVYVAGACLAAGPLVLFVLSRRSNLDHIPSFGYSTWIGSYIAAIKYTTNATQILQEGYRKYKSTPFKVAASNSCIVILGRNHLDDIKKLPDDELSLSEASNDFANVDYLFGKGVTSNPYHVVVTRTHLARNIAHYYPDIRDEIETAFNEILDLKDNEWKGIPAVATIREIVCRASNRVFVGMPLCRHPDWIDLNSQFAVDVMTDAFFLNMFPKFLVPLAANFVKNTARGIERAMRHLDPIIKQRQKYMSDYGEEWTDKPNDMLQWLMDEKQEFTVKDLTTRFLTMNFASIHSTSNTFTQALYHLVANPQYIQPLREEVDAVIEKYGWTKEGIAKMEKIDSFLTESQRFEGTLTASIRRKAMKDITLSDGTFIPKGTHILVATHAIHHDDAIYESANVFKPFRFCGGDGNPMNQIASVNHGYLPFGFGRHACPGRFLAAHELKTMLAHIVASYDIKLEDNSPPPNNTHFQVFVVVDPVAKIMFRKRVQK